MIRDTSALRVELADLWQAAPLNTELWGNAGHTCRSLELTPLYVQRYVGPRKGKPYLIHSFWEMTFTFRGQWSFFDPTYHAMRPDSLVVIPPELAHGEQSEEDVDTLWVGMQGTRLATLPTERSTVMIDAGLAPLCEQLWLCAQRRYDSAGPELDGLLQVIFGRFVRMWSQSALANRSKIDAALTYIHEHIENNLDVSRLAEICGYSEGHFYRMFKEHMGVTPNAYVARCRVEKAIQLMQQSTLSIARIGALVGYNDALYFSRVFRKTTGQAPSAMCAQIRRSLVGVALPPIVAAHAHEHPD